MKKILSPDSVALLLVLLFIYTAAGKLLNYPEYVIQMRRQALPAALVSLLIPVLPLAEIFVSVLLLVDRTRRLGLYLSLALLLLFTGYVALAVLGLFKQAPCSCGGVIRAMSWRTHLIFNLFFLLLTFIAIAYENRERRTKASI